MTELVRMEIFGATELARAFQQSPQTVSDELSAATVEALALIEREVKELTPIGASGGGGGLRDSISKRPVEKLSGRVIGVVGTNVTYAEAVELGTAPHQIPIKEIEGPLTNWVRYKLDVPWEQAPSVAYAVAKNIAMVGTSTQAQRTIGTKGWRMFKRGFESTRSEVVRILNKASARILDKIASGR